MVTIVPLEREFYSSREVETLTGLSHAGVWRAAARGDLPSVRIGKRILCPKRAIEALITNAIEQAPLARSRDDAA